MTQQKAADLARELQSAEAFAARVPPTRLGESASRQFLWATLSAAIVAILVLGGMWLIDPDRGELPATIRDGSVVLLPCFGSLLLVALVWKWVASRLSPRLSERLHAEFRRSGTVAVALPLAPVAGWDRPTAARAPVLLQTPTMADLAARQLVGEIDHAVAEPGFDRRDFRRQVLRAAQAGRGCRVRELFPGIQSDALIAVPVTGSVGQLILDRGDHLRVLPVFDRL